MAIQAQLYSENIALGGPLLSQDLLLMDNNNYYFNIPQQQQKRQKIEAFDQFQNFSHPKFNSFCVENQNMVLNDQESMAISMMLEKQRMEIDRVITLQNEELRLAIHEQTRQQIALFLQKNELKTQFLLKQKDEIIAKELNRTIELQNFLKRKEIENQTWQKLAKENEAMVASLNNTIERLRESVVGSSDDAESCCGDTAENDEITRRKMICKCCNNRNSCVVMLPCRHLCSCKSCEAFLDFCPVCRMVKRSSIEALI